MTKKIEADSALSLYKRLLIYIKNYKSIFLLAMLANAAYSAVDSGFIYMLKPILDRGFIDRDTAFIHWLPPIIVGLFLLRGVAYFIGSYAMAWVGRRVVLSIRQDIFNHLLKLPANYYDHQASGQLLATLVYNVDRVANACTDSITTITQSGFFVAGLLAGMLRVSWRFTLLYLTIVPVVALVVRYASKRLRGLNCSIQDSIGNVTHVAEESIEGYRVVRLFGGEEYERQKFAEITETNRRQEMKVVVTRCLSTTGVQLIAASALALTIFLTTSPLSMHMLSAGAFISLIAAMMALLKPMQRITKVNGNIQKGLAAAKSVFELLDEAPEPDNGQKTMSRARGQVSFQRLSFSYDGNKNVLEDINLEVAPGQTVALVGRSGSGKTTLVSLLPRFYEIQSGRILIDNTDIRDLSLKELRRQFSMVSQHVSLFNDTIANNIAYGAKRNVSRKEIVAAAKAAFAYEFIEKLPQDFDSLVGENGVLLSGGQRQRIAIARALLRDTPVLILDEATSALDTESERRIQKALEQLMVNRTTLVIAHRLSTIENADKIVVMDEGKIVEVGSHQQLLKQNGHYAKLYHMQFKDSESPVQTEVVNEVV